MTRTVGGRYRLYEFLANGDTGEVWQALDLGTDRAVAVKLLYPDLAADARLVDRLLRARAELTGLWHPSIARLLDVVVEDGVLALVTDLVPGTDLARRLARAGPMDWTAAAAVAESVADALSAAHRIGVVHGDVKPSNVVIPPSGDGPARLTDFSVNLLVRAGRRHPEPFDRLRYRAPEATEGAVPAPPSDVYALGAVLAEMMPAESPTQLRMLASACVQSDPGVRPSAIDVRDELRELTATRLTSAAGAPPARTMVTSVRRSGGAVPTRVRQPAARRRRASRAGGAKEAWLFGSPTRMAVVFAVAMAVVLGIFVATRAFWEAPGEAETAGPGGSSGPAPGGAASSSGAAAPSLPSGAAANTRDGGIEFVRFWFATLTHAQRTGDTVDLAKAASPDCGDCQKSITTIESTYEDGGSLRGGAYLVRNVSTNSLFSLDRPIYEATVDRSPRATVDRAGVERSSLPGLTVSNCILVLEWTDQRWRVLELTTSDCVA